MSIKAEKLLREAKHIIEKINKSHSNALINFDEHLVMNRLENLEIPKETNIAGEFIVIKDVFDMKGLLTSNGTLYGGNQLFPEKSAFIIEQLEELGAVILAKSNMYEYSLGVTSENETYGNVINPLNQYITAGGSSSGSAVSVAEGIVSYAIGTDTSGSTRIPASCNGVVGFKLGYNPLYLEGMTTISKELDHIGVFTQTVQDCQRLFNSLNHLKEKPNSENKPTIGVPNAFFNEGNDETINNMMSFAYHVLQAIGYEIVEIDTSFLMSFDPLKVSRTIGTKDISRTAYDREKKGLYPSERIVSINKQGASISNDDYNDALDKKRYITQKFNKLFSDVDVILTPVMPIVTPFVNQAYINRRHKEEDISDVIVQYTNIFNLTGHPAMSIPSGYYARKISQGIQLIVNNNNEYILFDVANSYEHYIEE
ncbi:amidase [Mammaliicoccus sciuri]|uniref:amidase n=1 Tax=Mammaliicoccus sciuri TaxID=1296 RepID=UPI002DBCB7AB|nr:amidase [Mammaliicoccus sciuri]MEB6696258.1 amidase [Mammaliicoccus sciuri]